MKAVNGLHVLLLSAILCAVVQTAAGQSSAKAEVRSGHFSTSESGIS